MKKLLIVFLTIFIPFIIFSYSYTPNAKDTTNLKDIEDVDLSSLASEDTVLLDLGIHGPVDTYSPAIKFNTRFILNEKFRLAVVGDFFNEASFYDYKDDKSGDNFKVQNWPDIKNFLDVYLGYRLNDNIHLGFMLGGGTNISEYYKANDIANNKIIEHKNGYGFIRTGLSAKLNSNLFKDNMKYFFVEQYFDVDILGNGSVGIENFAFGTSLKRVGYMGYDSVPVLSSSFLDAVSNPTSINSADNSADSKFEYYGFKTYGKLGISLPFNQLFQMFSMFDAFDFNIELENKLSMKFFTNYYNNGISNNYTIKNHIDYSGVAILFGIVFRPIKELEIKVNYKPNFLVYGTTWLNLNKNACRDYSFYIVHELEASAYFVFPQVVTLKLGTMYYIKQTIEYQYQNDGTNTKESIGGGTLTHELAHQIEPVLELGFRLLDKEKAYALLNFCWQPKIILYDSANDTYQVDLTQTNYQLNTNVFNLANWKIELTIKFDPKAIADAKNNTKKTEKDTNNISNDSDNNNIEDNIKE